MRNLRIARRGAIDQRTDTPRQIRALIITAPDELRQQLRELTTPRLIATCAAAIPDPADAAGPATAVQLALRSMARRHQEQFVEIADLDKQLERLVAAINLRLITVNGMGPDIAGQLLVTASENHEAAFAMLCGAAPIPASSGKTTRHLYRFITHRVVLDLRL